MHGGVWETLVYHRKRLIVPAALIAGGLMMGINHMRMRENYIDPIQTVVDTILCVVPVAIGLLWTYALSRYATDHQSSIQNTSEDK